VSDPNAQIKRLQEILKDLGMGTRPSMAKARKIKIRRELLEDVGAFIAFLDPIFQVQIAS
jgi:hypothetical protein